MARNQSFYQEEVVATLTAASSGGNTSALSGYGPTVGLALYVNVTTITGSGATLTVFLDESFDGGTTWALGTKSTAGLTATGVTKLVQTDPFPDTIRVRWTITG